jgi:hypothetical protein
MKVMDTVRLEHPSSTNCNTNGCNGCDVELVPDTLKCSTSNFLQLQRRLILFTTPMYKPLKVSHLVHFSGFSCNNQIAFIGTKKDGNNIISEIQGNVKYDRN